MGFMDEVTEELRPATTCRTCQLLDSLPADERADVIAVLEDKSIPCAPIVRALARRGYEIGESALLRHRKRPSCVHS